MPVSEVTTKFAAVPLNVTPEVPVKFVPLMATLVPAGPLVGVKLVIVGGAPFKNAFRTFVVARWIRGSRTKCRNTPNTSSSAQLQDIVPEAKTHAPLGA